MSQRWITWSLAAAAFLITLAISSWHEGLWTADHSTAPRVVRPQAMVAAQGPNSPFGPVSPAIKVAAAPLTTVVQPEPPLAAVPAAQEQQDPPPPVSDPEPQTESYNTPDVDNGEMLERADQAARRSARAH